MCKSSDTNHMPLCATWCEGLFVCLLVAYVPATGYSVSQGRICSDNFMCFHTEIEAADRYLTQSQYTDTGPNSPSADPITPGAWQGCANFLSHWYDSTPKKSHRKRDSNPRSSALEADALPLGQRGGGCEGTSRLVLCPCVGFSLFLLLSVSLLT